MLHKDSPISSKMVQDIHSAGTQKNSCVQTRYGLLNGAGVPKNAYVNRRETCKNRRKTDPKIGVPFTLTVLPPQPP